MTVTKLGRDQQHAVMEVIARLDRSISEQVPRLAIAEMVEQCVLDLQPVSAAALPEMLERLARHRLHNYVSEPSLWLS
jgi:hypothetical protein